MTPTQQARATAHVIELCTKYGIIMRKAKCWNRSVAFPDTRIVYLPPRMSDATDYLVSLHEIGHCVDRRAVKLLHQEDQTSSILCEAAAWAWAYRNIDRAACPVVPKRTRATIADLWATYLPSRPNRESA